MSETEYVYTIERGIELTPRPHRPLIWGHLLKQMQVGDSIVVEDKRKAGLLQTSGYRMKMKFAYRVLSDNRARIWRIS